MTIAVAVAFSVFCVLCVGLVLLGLPGTWLMLLGAVLLERYGGALPGASASGVTFGWWLIAGGLVLAILGEAVELLAGALGAKGGGATRRGTVGAFAGGLLGMLLGTVLIPVPIVGTALGVLAGTFGGAMAGEMTHPEQRRSSQEALRPALAATAGRVLGTVGKAAIAAALGLALSVAAFLA